MSAATNTKVLLSLADLAALGVAISRQTAWRWFHTRKMPMPVKITGARNERLLWAAADIHRWIDERVSKPP